MNGKANVTVDEQHGVIQPATAGDLVYKAFSRPYAGGPGQVINLFASCSYPTGGWEIFFVGDGAGGYKCMEQVPRLVYQLVTYYVASYTTGYGLANPVQEVTITDAHGAHKIPVEPLE